MTHHIDPCDTARNNVLAAALALQQCTKTAANIVVIPGTGRFVAIGTRAEVARLLKLDTAAATMQASTAQADLPAILFDGHAVYNEVMASDPNTPRPTPDNVANVLDAVVNLMRRSATSSTDAQAAAEVRDAWISVDERLPEKYCLASYRTSRGVQRTIRAMHVKQYEIEANGDECDSETNDDDDMEYIKAGWYECIDNWGDYSSVKVNEGTVTHWMPLPAAPGALRAGDTGSAQ